MHFSVLRPSKLALSFLLFCPALKLFESWLAPHVITHDEQPQEHFYSQSCCHSTPPVSNKPICNIDCITGTLQSVFCTCDVFTRLYWVKLSHFCVHIYTLLAGSWMIYRSKSRDMVFIAFCFHSANNTSFVIFTCAVKSSKPLSEWTIAS